MKKITTKFTAIAMAMLMACSCFAAASAAPADAAEEATATEFFEILCDYTGNAATGEQAIVIAGEKGWVNAEDLAEIADDADAPIKTEVAIKAILLASGRTRVKADLDPDYDVCMDQAKGMGIIKRSFDEETMTHADIEYTLARLTKLENWLTRIDEAGKRDYEPVVEEEPVEEEKPSIEDILGELVDKIDEILNGKDSTEE